MPEPDGLRRIVAAAIRDGVRVRLGSNALDMADRGLPVMLNYSEAQAAADAALAVLGLDHPADGAHRYLSTGCLHAAEPGREELHGYCQSYTGHAGSKIPAQCKFCAAPCLCTCHAGQPAPEDAGR